MKLEKFPSYAIPLGPIESEWHQPEFDDSFVAVLNYDTFLSDGIRQYVGSVSGATRSLYSSKQIFDKGKRERLVESIGGVAREIDEYVRDIRGLAEDTDTKVIIQRRSGLARANPVLPRVQAKIQQKLALDAGLLSAGAVHIDRFGPMANDENTDSVIICHRGKPTVVHEGMLFGVAFNAELVETNIIRIYTKVLLFGRGSRIFASNSYHIPQDTAVLINENTLHHQAAQRWRNKSKMGVFLRARVQVVNMPEDKEL